jgi:hypothetical protein
MSMNDKPPTTLDKWTVNYGDGLMESSHYFPTEYDEEGLPIGERHKATVVISQDQVCVSVYDLNANTENGTWEWKRLREIWFSLSQFRADGEKALHMYRGW